MFRERFIAAKKRFNLSDSDLAVWLGRPRISVRHWRLYTGGPSDPETQKEIAARLDLLEGLRSFPEPVSWRRRKSDILEALRNAEARGIDRVPESDPANFGPVLRHDNPEQTS